MNDVPSWVAPDSPATERRIPVYLLLDTSGSMAGAPIEAVNMGLSTFYQDVMENVMARDSVYVGIISFNDDAQMVTPGLVSIRDFQPPKLQASGTTRLDRAFDVLRESLHRDIIKPVIGKQRGDGRPIVFVFTDGQPTAEWKAARDSVVSSQMGGTAESGTVRLYDIYAVGCGTDVDDDTLKEISTGMAFHYGRDDIGFGSFIRLVTMVSVLSAERQGAAGRDTGGVAPLLSEDDLPPELIDQRIP